MSKTFFTHLFILGVVLGFAFTAVAQDNNAGKVPTTTEKPTVNYSIAPEAPTSAATAYGWSSIAGQFLSMPIPAGDPFTLIGPMTAPGFLSSADFGPDGTLYFTDTSTDELYTVNIVTGTLTLVGSTGGANLNGITYDWANDVFWGVSATALYTVDVITGATSLVGSFGLGGGELMIDVAVDCDGNMYAYDIVSNGFYSIDPATGAATLIGDIGYDANYGQGMSYDHSTGILYLSAFNNITSTGQLRTVDVATGNTTLVFDWGFEQIAPFAIDQTCGAPCTVGDPSNPNPADGTVDVPIDLPEISWTNTPEATEIELFFGPIGNVVSVYSGAPIISFALSGLDYSTGYMWFVKQSDGDCWITGPAWTFITMDDPNMPYVFADEFPTDMSQWTPLGPFGLVNWSWQNTNNAGGDPGEMRFSWTPSFVGDSYVISDVIPSAGLYLTVQFNHFLWFYGGPFTIGFGYTTDEGITWTELWSAVDPPGDIGPETLILPSVPGDTNFQLGFWFSGDSFNLNYWYIDNVYVYMNWACMVGDPSNPDPANGATEVPITLPEISWTNTPEATEIELFFGPVGSVTSVYLGAPITSFALTGLDYSTEYMWFVKQSNGYCWITGPTWTFTTMDDPNIVFAFIDEFPTDISQWTILGPLGLDNWSWQNTNNAGGDPGEMRFSWDPLVIGDSYVISDTIPSAGQDLTVKFSHFLNLYGGPFTIGFGYTTDGGTTWTELWSAVDPPGNIGPETLTFLNVPGDANFQLGAWFSGLSANLEYWYIDNVYVSYIVPVEMTSFAASVSDGDVTLNWSTATELNNQGFEIERKVGSKQSAVGNWDKIGHVAGFGTTTEPKTYSFIDYNVTTGIYSYRLKQIDYNGTFEYSDAVEVDVTVPKVFSLEQNYPNPFNPGTMIKFSLAADSRVTLTVFDILGQEVATLISDNLAAGSHEFNFDASNLNSGVYFYRIVATGDNGTNFTSVKKMILTK